MVKTIAIVAGIAGIIFALSYGAFKPVKPLPVATSTSVSPINSIDFFSGKPVMSTSPTTVYKGYRVGFCCSVSKSKWDLLSEPKKDKYIWQYLP